MLGPDRPRFVNKSVPAQPSPGCEPVSAEPLSPEQWAALQRFVALVGGIDNARSALELLAILAATGHTPPKTAR